MKNTQKLIQRLISNECACYSSTLNDIKNYCDKEKEKDYVCSLFKNKRCEYFERAVLPMNPQLEALYQAEKSGYKLPKDDEESISTIKGKVNIHCKRCKRVFLANNYRSRYCENCKRFLRRESTRIAMEKKRKIGCQK